MLDIKRTIENLIGIKVTEDFKNDVICAFDTSEKEIIVSEDESNQHIDYQAYENDEDSPIICIRIENEEIVEAWEA
ncbi:hypothetical protein CLPU_58c00010 [Gottschalkia purinilytica]|uniref:Uncharacterized protein n=1 Tax=Gottschalkia purinilytica TaxID=1503 RepID=A0A0L0W5Y4_GOTPU|nr:hypothetical protein [Gottschalkia purinilytica]KNF06938.1 hypothetical protein CLPU_58c00010 [Gottschalkia purinilytica]